MVGSDLEKIISIFDLKIQACSLFWSNRSDRANGKCPYVHVLPNTILLKLNNLSGQMLPDNKTKPLTKT